MEVMSGMENKFPEHRWGNYRAERCGDTEGGKKEILTLVKEH